MNGAMINGLPDFSIDSCKSIETRFKKQIRAVKRADRCASYIVSNPYSGQLHSRPSINFLEIGIPTPENLHFKTERKRPISIIHAPSNPLVKGSAEIEEALSSISSQYPEGTLQIHIGTMPNTEFMKKIAEADLVIDQLYTDTPLPGIATECATVGTPCLIFGYWKNYWSKYAGHIPKTVPHPGSVKEEILAFCQDPAPYKAEAQKLNRFVSQNWSPTQVTQKYISIIEDSETLSAVSPVAFDELFPAGMSQEKMEQFLAQSLEFGIDFKAMLRAARR